MKTTHLLTTWALSALFVACTADEFKVANPDNVSQDRAKVHPDFVLLTEDLQTRYAVEGGAGISFDFEKGDRLGAALVDEYVEGENPENFEVLPFALENHSLDCQGNGEWTPDAQLSVGHYLYLYPYNSEDASAQGEPPSYTGLIYKLPIVQEMYTDGSTLHVLNAAIENGNQAISAGVLHECDRQANVELKNLFTYPKLTIYFDSAEPVTSVSQIVLKTEGTDPFVVKGEFEHRIVADMFMQNHHGTITNKDFWDETTQTVDWDKVGTYDFLYDGSASPYGEAEYSNQIVVKFADDAQVGEDYTTKNKFVEARIMMPSIDNFAPELDDPSASTGIVMYVYTDNGVYKTPFQASSFDFKATTDKEMQQAALWRNRSNGLTLKPLTADNKTEDAENYVATQEEWNNLVGMYGNSGIDREIAIVGDEFVFDENTQWPTNCRFYLTTDVSVEGNVEIKNVSVRQNNITVTEGSTLTLGNTLEAWQIINDGTLLVTSSVATKSEGYYDGISVVVNRGTMDIAEGAKFEFMTIETTGGAVTNNAGDIRTDMYNYGTVNNYGIIRAGSISNVVDMGSSRGSIENAVGAEIWVESLFSNYADVVNKGTLSCENPENVFITNTGQIYSMSGATTYLTKNHYGGIVYVYTADAAGLTIEGEKGTVEYTATQPAEDFTNSLVNQVVATEDLTILGGEIETLYFRGDEAALVLNEGSKVNWLSVDSGKLTLASDMGLEMLSVRQDAELVIATGATLNFNGFPEYFGNYGRIVVNGTLMAPALDEGDYGVGTIDVEGGDVIWRDQSPEQAEQIYDAAVQDLVQAWILSSEQISWELVENIGSWDWQSAISSSSGSENWYMLATIAKNAYCDWREALGENPVDSYNTLQYVTNILPKEASEGGKIYALIQQYKAESYNGVPAAFNGVLPYNDWLMVSTPMDESGVYFKPSADTKLEDITNESSMNMLDMFVDAASRITRASVNVSTNSDETEREVENKAIWLTLKSGLNKEIVAQHPDWIPDYSYVCLYEGSEFSEYEVMDGLLNNDFGDWFKSIVETGGWTFETLKEVHWGIWAVKQAADGNNPNVDASEQNKIKASGLLDYVDVVMHEWRFTDAQIKFMNKRLKK